MENYYIINRETGKLELHFSKDTYTDLPDETKARIKSVFLWGRKSGCWISRAAWPNLYHAQKLAKELALTDGGEIGERPAFADQMARKAERAEHRAERYTDHAAAAQARGEALQKPLNDMHGDIAFFTQPNINTSAGRAFTRQRERMYASFERGFEEFNKSAYWRERAQIAQHTADQTTLRDKGFIQRRIDERAADIRKLRRNIDELQRRIDSGEPVSDERQQARADQMAHWMDMLEAKLDELGYYQDALDALGGVTFNRSNLQPGDLLKLFRWPKPVRYLSGGPKNFTYEFTQPNMKLADGTMMCGKAAYADIVCKLTPPEPAAEPAEPSPEIIPGIGYSVHDGKGCADISPELFARLYAAPAGDTPSREEKLTRALQRALIAALAFGEHEDGGTCNFDSPSLDFKQAGFNQSEAENIIKRVGLNCYEWTFGRSKALVITGATFGQGNRRSEMAEAFSESLKSEGYPAGMYYQMD